MSKLKLTVGAVLAAALASCGATAPVCAADDLKTYDVERDRFVVLTDIPDGFCPAGWWLAQWYTSERQERQRGCWTAQPLEPTLTVKFGKERPTVYEKLSFFREYRSTYQFY